MTQHDISIERNVPVVMRDDVTLRADIYRPRGEGPWPVLVHRTPYFKSHVLNTLLADLYDAATRGYIVVHQDVRGRSDSDGEWLPWVHEREDGYDTIEWAARLHGSNGRVGMIGASYTGSTQWSAAISGAPSLLAVAPVTTWADPADGLLFRGGAAELGLNSAWALQTAMGQIPKEDLAPEILHEMMSRAAEAYDAFPQRTYWELPSGAQPSVVATGQPDLGLARALQDESTLLDSRVLGQGHRVNVPSLNVGGWFDVFQQGTIDNYTEMRRHGQVARLVMGPWNHTSVLGITGGQTGATNFGIGSVVSPGHASMSGLVLDWHDHWLRDQPASELHRSGVDVFTMGRNEWREEAEWPLARAVPTPLYLGEGENAGFDAPHRESSGSSFIYDPLDPVLTTGGALVMTSEYVAGPADQRDVESRDDVLVFTTAPLEKEVEVTGAVRARLFVSTDAVSTDFVVRLCDVDEQGISRNVADGILRRSFTPGEVTEIEVDLWSTSVAFAEGHRIRVHVTSSNFPRWDRNFNTGRSALTADEAQLAHQTVHHDPTRPSAVILPVIPN